MSSQPQHRAWHRVHVQCKFGGRLSEHESCCHRGNSSEARLYHKVQSTGPAGHPRPAQWPMALPQGPYLGVGKVDTMVPGIGCGSWKGNHSGSPEAVPADPYE